MPNYVSPYGFGPVTDAVLDAVAERHGFTADEVADKLDLPAPEEDGEATIRDWIEQQAWDTVLGPAVDEFDNRLFPQDST